MKKAFITGITGQDGSYLADLLLEKGYEVHGLNRRSSLDNTSRLAETIKKYQDSGKLHMHYGDMTDSLSLTRLIGSIRPDEIYNLAAQSHVAVSFEQPEYTANVDAVGTLRILEAVRINGLANKTKIYQASTSELYGLVQETPQKESTPFHPRSPYAVAKMYAYWITVNYREAYNMYACNGVLFNHESPRRGDTFVTRKITKGLARFVNGLDSHLVMGNLDSLRDWGHAKDYVEMQWLMLQQEKPEDYVIATGQQYSIREFIQWACEDLGIKIEFKGTGVEEVAIIVDFDTTKFKKLKKGDVIVSVSDKYFRPAEVATLLGDPTKARKKLGWSPKITAREMCKEMVESDYIEALKESEWDNK